MSKNFPSDPSASNSLPAIDHSTNPTIIERSESLEALGETIQDIPHAKTDSNLAQVRNSRSSIEATTATENWADNLQIVGQLGRGGMGEVLVAFDPILRRDLAVKVLSPSGSETSAEFSARFLAEAQVTAQLEHPNVVPIHQYGLSPSGKAYFTMKRVRGVSLRQILDRIRQGDTATIQSYPRRRLLEIFLDVTQAIRYAHAQSVLHRDIKPDNIMVGSFDEVLVMDWGIARIGGAPEEKSASDSTVLNTPDRFATMHGTIMGTPSYMSPEQARGASVDEKTDIYSLGAVLYEILTGEAPFEDKDPYEVVRMVLAEPVIPPSVKNPKAKIPPALEELCLKLLEKDAARRNIDIIQLRNSVQDTIDGINADRGVRGASNPSSLLFFSGVSATIAWWYLSGQSAFSIPTLGAWLIGICWYLAALAGKMPIREFLEQRREAIDSMDRFENLSSTQAVTILQRQTLRKAAALSPLLAFGCFGIGFTWLILGRNFNLADSAKLSALLLVAATTGSIFSLFYLVSTAWESKLARRSGKFEPLAQSRWAEYLFPVLGPLAFLAGYAKLIIEEYHRSSSLFGAEDVRENAQLILDLVRTLVLQGSFLIAASICLLLFLFPIPEILAALRLPTLPHGENYLSQRREFLIRSIAIYRIASLNTMYLATFVCLCGALNVVSQQGAQSPNLLIALQLLLPIIAGMAISLLISGSLRHYLKQSPAAEGLLNQHSRSLNNHLRQLQLELIHEASETPILGKLGMRLPILGISIAAAWWGFHNTTALTPPIESSWQLLLSFLCFGMAPALLILFLAQLNRDYFIGAIMRWRNKDNSSKINLDAA